MNRAFLFLDVETTGKDASRNDIVEMAGRIYINDKPRKSFMFRCRPMNMDTIEDEALKVNGKTRGEILKYPAPFKVVQELEKILKEYYVLTDPYVLAGHNVSFDKRFLFSWFYKNNRPDMIRFIDERLDVCTLALAKYVKAKGLLKGKRNSLGSLCKQLDINLENAHTASADIDATIKLYYKLEDLLRDGLTRQLTLF